MARIRTVKPEFFRHEGLQDLERDNPGQYVMLTFIGLWSLCDKAGRFEWRPRTIKLDILPFIEFEMEKTLALLECFSYVRRYEIDGKQYGEVPSFSDHQRITGKEAQDGTKYPEPIDYIEINNGEATGKQQGSTREATGSPGREGKGREEEKEGKGKDLVKSSPPIHPPIMAKAGAAKTAMTWNAYATEYQEVYGAEPVRNAKVNGQLANVIDRIGAIDAPSVAAWFIHHRKRWYVEKGHSVECLQKDCEQLRTEWATGRRSTSTAAMQADRTQTTGSVFAELLAEQQESKLEAR